jgi:hypothetical protein
VHKDFNPADYSPQDYTNKFDINSEILLIIQADFDKIEKKF